MAVKMKDVLSIKVINMEHRLDRKNECRTEFDSIGLGDGDYSFFKAKYLPELAARGCALSHGQALAEFLSEEEKPFVLILEDDFSIREKEIFIPSLQESLGHAFLWDVFLLAHNDSIPISGTQQKNTFRVINARTASGYLTGRLYVSKLIETFFRSAELLKRADVLPSPNKELATSAFSCDILWKELQVKDRFWARQPSLTFQRPSYSDIEKKLVDYKA
jgi:hypothetical protein